MSSIEQLHRDGDCGFDCPACAEDAMHEQSHDPTKERECRRCGETDFENGEGEAEEGPTYHGIVRYTHVRCGYTTRVRSEMEILNDGDPACPACSGECNPEDCFPWPCRWPYGEMVWENSDGTMVETYHDGQELTRWQPVRTHVQIYKSWVNGPEWWVVPRPNTGDLDDNLIVGFDTHQQALDALPNLRSTFADLYGPPVEGGIVGGIAWRDRNDPIYQTTTPKEGLRF